MTTTTTRPKKNALAVTAAQGANLANQRNSPSASDAKVTQQ